MLFAPLARQLADPAELASPADAIGVALAADPADRPDGLVAKGRRWGFLVLAVGGHGAAVVLAAWLAMAAPEGAEGGPGEGGIGAGISVALVPGPLGSGAVTTPGTVDTLATPPADAASIVAAAEVLPTEADIPLADAVPPLEPPSPEPALDVAVAEAVPTEPPDPDMAPPDIVRADPVRPDPVRAEALPPLPADPASAVAEALAPAEAEPADDGLAPAAEETIEPTVTATAEEPAAQPDPV
ncbi:MAG: hypothetical protein KDA49_00040, partial [Rhodospirillaceae bacterium]|nr:hypothetical protein [Rhodospirillaceae bacterium]